MIIPLVAQKMLSYNSNFWMVYFQYNVEFTPIVVVAGYILTSKIKKDKIANVVAFSLFLMTTATLIYTIDYGQFWHNKQRAQIFRVKHYTQKKFDVTVAYSFMEQIPDTASVCASGIFVPHLCLRKEIYTFPYKKEFDAEWMLLYEEKRHIDFLLNDYTIVNNKDKLWLLRKNQIKEN